MKKENTILVSPVAVFLSEALHLFYYCCYIFYSFIIYCQVCLHIQITGVGVTVNNDERRIKKEKQKL